MFVFMSNEKCTKATQEPLIYQVRFFRVRALCDTCTEPCFLERQTMTFDASMQMRGFSVRHAWGTNHSVTGTYRSFMTPFPFWATTSASVAQRCISGVRETYGTFQKCFD